MLRWKSLLLVAGVLSLFPLPPATAESPEEPLRLKVMCYNIHHGEGTDGKIDLPRLAEVIRQADADLVSLQEVDNQTRRTNMVDQLATLAELTGLHGRFAKQIDYEGGEYGQAILSRFPPSEVTVTWLPGDPQREQRIVAFVDVTVSGRKLRFASTHLHHADEPTRIEQVQAINTMFQDTEIPVVLTGDLNAVPGSRPMELLKPHWASATAGRDDRLTFPAPVPERQLDYVLFRPKDAFTVISSEVIDEAVASDHRPLLVELEWK